MTDGPPDCVLVESGSGMWLPGQCDVLATSPGIHYPYTFPFSFVFGRETLPLEKDS